MLESREAPSGTFQRSPEAVWRALPDGVVILPRGADEPITVSGPGADVWSHLAEPHTRKSLATVLIGRYAEDPAVIEADIAALLAELHLRGAVSYRADRSTS